tara:strand:- start:5209 stop:5691 length:483 start_codon:yes stop_codon:yes gene_type:complete
MKENSSIPFFVFIAVCGGVAFLLKSYLPMSLPAALLAYGFYANHIDSKNENITNNSTSPIEDENETTSFPLLTDQFIVDDIETSSSSNFIEPEFQSDILEADFMTNDFAVNPANGLPMISGSSIDIEGNPFGTDFSDDYTSSTFDDSFNDISSFDDSFMS